MKTELDIAAICARIPGDNPAGENLRYAQVYEDIKEARRTDDSLNLGDWKHAVKTSDWDKVIVLTSDVLSKKTKDLQLASWLTEALLHEEGFEGLAAGISIINRFLKDYWESIYPQIEDGDIEYRTAPIAFINDRLSIKLLQIPITDVTSTAGHSFLKWQESRTVGYESGLINQNGDIDDDKEKKRNDLIGEGKLTAEAFDAAVAASPRGFYEVLMKNVALCSRELSELDATLDDKFGEYAPGLSEFTKSLDDCGTLIKKIFREKGGRDDYEESVPVETGPEPPAAEAQIDEEAETSETESPTTEATGSKKEEIKSPLLTPDISGSDGRSDEILLEESLQMTKTSGFEKTLGHLLTLCHSAPSLRETNRYRLIMAKLCLKEGRPELARPIVEELYALIEELHLERWESHSWIAEVIAAFHKCLIHGNPSEDEAKKAQALFQRLCRVDITKAFNN